MPIPATIRAGLAPAALGKGGPAAAYASFPAPAGYRWDFVMAFGARVFAFGQPAVALVQI